MVHPRSPRRYLSLSLFILLGSGVSPASALSSPPTISASDAVVYQHFFPYPTSYTQVDLRFAKDRLTAAVVRAQPFPFKTVRLSHDALLLRPRLDFRARMLRADELLD